MCSGVSLCARSACEAARKTPLDYRILNEPSPGGRSYLAVEVTVRYKTVRRSLSLSSLTAPFATSRGEFHARERLIESMSEDQLLVLLVDFTGNFSCPSFAGTDLHEQQSRHAFFLCIYRERNQQWKEDCEVCF